MHPQQKHGSCSPRMLKVAMGMMGFCLSVYIVGPQLYWHMSDGFAAVRRSSCPSCLCDCTSDHPSLSFPEGLNNTSFTDCMKHDPGVSKEMERNFTEMLTEELKLREAEATENQHRADMALLEAKKMVSQYQKEADKCNSGMGTCDDAREKAEATLQAQKEITTMWELRARLKGWKDRRVKTRVKHFKGARMRIDNM